MQEVCGRNVGSTFEHFAISRKSAIRWVRLGCGYTVCQSLLTGRDPQKKRRKTINREEKKSPKERLAQDSPSPFHLNLHATPCIVIRECSLLPQLLRISRVFHQHPDPFGLQNFEVSGRHGDLAARELPPDIIVAFSRQPHRWLTWSQGHLKPVIIYFP